MASRSRTVVGRVALVCVLAVVVLGGQVIATRSQNLPRAAAHLRLYRLTSTQDRLEAVNMVTLRDVPSRVIRLTRWDSGSDMPGIAVTPDGATLLTVLNKPAPHVPIRSSDQTIRVLDARRGVPEGPGLHPADPIVLNGVSADGAAAYGFAADAREVDPCSAHTFYALSTRTGQVISHVAVPLSAQIQIDPYRRRLYTLTDVDQLSVCNGPRVRFPIVHAYDLDHGRLVVSRRLRSVFAGRWFTGQHVGGQPVMAVWEPAFALSPDGRSLAIVDGHDNALTVLDPSSLRTLAVRKLVVQPTMFEQLASFLGLMPETAEAKGQTTGAGLNAQYTADGRSLIVSGGRYSPDPHALTGRASTLGLRLVDARTGIVRVWKRTIPGAEGPGAQPVSFSIPLTGDSIFISTQGWSRREGWTCIVTRLDPNTLAPIARRTFDHVGDWWLRLYFVRG